jgi:SAM-dependent methyltransferase
MPWNLSLLLFSLSALSAAPLEQEETIRGGDRLSEVFAHHRHGSDESVFLDDYIRRFLKELDGCYLLDAGCGSGTWAIEAAQRGAFVIGVDTEPEMIERARGAAADAGVGDRVELTVGHITSLANRKELFDAALSIHVGCCLPSLGLHMRQIAKSLKPSGRVLVTAPASFDILFTDDSEVEELQQPIDRQVLEKISSIYRGTFVERNDKLDLVRDASRLFEGQPIWSKIPGHVIPNYYHPEESYLDAFWAAGLEVVATHRPCFSSEAERLAYYTWHPNGGGPHLGSAYVGNPPFIIFELRKQ